MKEEEKWAQLINKNNPKPKAEEENKAIAKFKRNIELKESGRPEINMTARELFVCALFFERQEVLNNAKPVVNEKRLMNDPIGDISVDPKATALPSDDSNVEQTFESDTQRIDDNLKQEKPSKNRVIIENIEKLFKKPDQNVNKIVDDLTSMDTPDLSSTNTAKINKDLENFKKLPTMADMQDFVDTYSLKEHMELIKKAMAAKSNSKDENQKGSQKRPPNDQASNSKKQNKRGRKH